MPNNPQTSARRMNMIRKLLVFITLLASLLVLRPALAAAGDSALTTADRTAIHAVITQQIKALQADNLEEAFSLSAPDVRRQFGTADAFAEMIRADYEPLIRHYSRAFMQLTVEDEEVIQPVRLVNRDGTVVMALFGMERQPDGEWRVYGCQMAQTDLHAA